MLGYKSAQATRRIINVYRVKCSVTKFGLASTPAASTIVVSCIEKAANSLKRSETFPPDLIRALNETLKTMP